MTKRAERWPVIVLHAAVALAAAGLYVRPDHWGRDDWDYFAHQYEAMRRTVLEYHQVPWWNPWSSGGLPLAANPQVGFISFPFLLVLVLGTYEGLRVATVLHLLLAAEGARRLAGLWMSDAVARSIAGFVFALNGAMVLHVAAGHLGIHTIAWLPWAMYCCFRMEHDHRWGHALGGVLAAAILESLHYFTVYVVLAAAGLAVWRCALGLRRGDWTGLRAACFAAGLCAAIAGWRVVLAAELIQDFPRPRSQQTPQAIGPLRLLTMLALPGQTMKFEPPEWVGRHWLGWHEYGCYVGLPVLVLFALSLRGGVRWWHVLAAVAVWLAIGNRYWYHPSGWMGELPLLSALRLSSRWRVAATLGLALGVAAVVERWRGMGSRPYMAMAHLAVLCIGLDLGVQAWLTFRNVFIEPPGPRGVDRGADFVQVEVLHGSHTSYAGMLATLRANRGVIYGYEPLIGQDDDPLSARLWVGHPEYRGEYASLEGPVRLVRWTPNAIDLEGPRGGEVWINQNPGSYWLVNGRREYAALRSVDRHADFRVRADAAGRVYLAASPQSLGAAAASSLAASLVWLTGLVWARWRRVNRGR